MVDKKNSACLLLNLLLKLSYLIALFTALAGFLLTLSACACYRLPCNSRGLGTQSHLTCKL